ncbi:MAG: vWA domain-containing protein [Gaiellales bacterium]
MRAAIPLVGAGELRRVFRRTRLIRLALAVALVALVLVTALLASRPTSHPLRFLPRASNGIIVLDLSASISSDTFNRIGETLDELAGTNGRYGLILFSDVAYEALPPGTPSASLRPYARYFKVPPQAAPGLLASFPLNPWASSFSAGTRISAGLGLALQLIRQQRLSHPGVILISDLDDDPADLGNVARGILAYRQLGYDLRIVALDPSPDDRDRFRALLNNAARITNANLPGDRTSSSGARFPVALASLVALVALLLAANELHGARLSWETGA